MLPTIDPSILCVAGLYLLLILLLGYTFISAVLGGGVRHWVQLLAYSYTAGTGLLAFILFAISLAGIAPCRAILICVAVGSIASILLLRRRRKLCVLSVPARRQRIDPLAILALLGLALIAAAGANVATAAALPGLNDIDSFGIWAFKAKWVYFSALRPLPFSFVDPTLSYAHQDYPLLVPLDISGLYAMLGRVNEDAAKLLLGPTWLALVGVIYGAIRRFHRRALAVVLTAIFCSAPILTRNAGVIVAETPLVLALAAAVAQLLCWVDEADPRELALGALFIAMAAFTKNEGLALLPVYGMVAMTVACLRTRTTSDLLLSPFPVPRERTKVRAVTSDAHKDQHKRFSPPPPSGVPGEGASQPHDPIRQLLPAGLVCLICIAPWLLFRRNLPHTHEDYGDRLLSTAIIRQIPQRIGKLGLFFQYFWSATHAGITWYLLALTTLLWPGRLRTKAALSLWAILLAQLCLYLATFIVTPWDVNELLPMITPKLQIQMTPVAILLIAVNLRTVNKTHTAK